MLAKQVSPRSTALSRACSETGQPSRRLSPTAWSNGPVEGQINRLKLIQRQMYGRAGFQLLRTRVLPYRPAFTASLPARAP